MKTLRSVPGLALITTALATCKGEPSSAPSVDMRRPGPLHVLTEGGIGADLSGVEAGALFGFPGSPL